MMARMTRAYVLRADLKHVKQPQTRSNANEAETSSPQSIFVKLPKFRMGCFKAGIQAACLIVQKIISID